MRGQAVESWFETVRPAERPRLRPVSAEVDAARLKWLFLDLNSYFASVEQQVEPRLRGRPVIVVPLLSDHTCAIAASYEAKAFGIKTGMGVREAKARCAQLAIRPARHDLYVEFHHRIVAEIERHIPVTKVCSIDEVACELDRSERHAPAAVALARRIKVGIARHVGGTLGSSIGIAPSRLLAKIASDMQKPDGLTVLGADALPGPLLTLALRDLPGIGVNMQRRLAEAGIRTVADLWALDAPRARAKWGGIGGAEFWWGLRGIDAPERATVRRSVGHSHVISPANRQPDSVRLIARRLLTKAASRLRRLDDRAALITLGARLESRRDIAVAARIAPTADSFALLQRLDALWPQVLREAARERIKRIGVTLGELVPAGACTGDLFGWSPRTADATAGMRASAALDAINRRFGRDCVTIGVAPRISPYAGAKIAFNRIPEREDFAM